MAILRGGRRIGNFDIRVGLPRDKSLVDVAKDPRLKRKPGGAGTIQRFLSHINQGEGFARPNRFIVRINLPRPIGSLVNNKGLNDLESNQMVENIDMMCNSVVLPNRDINTATAETYGPRREMPYAYSYSAKIECTFLGDKFLRQRMFFENWQKKIMDINSHHMEFYDNYVGSMDIYQLGSFDVQQEEVIQAGPPNRNVKVPKQQIDNASVTYGVRLFEVYPQTIGSIGYNSGTSNSAVEVPVTLNFRKWSNLTIDQIDGATVGKSEGDVPTIKASKDFGLFSGILGALPPELQRAGRDVLQTTKRNLPIGRVTGGRAFPPFG